MVLRFDRERNRISLGIKQILPDPWEDIQSTLRVGTTVTGKVTRIVPFGAFVRLESGVEGICPNAELPGEKGRRSADVLSPGQEIQAKIVNIRPGERRMTLSMRQVEQAKERAELKEYMRRQEDDSRVTIGDLFGSVLSEAADNGRAPAGEDTEGESGPAAAEDAEDSSGDPRAATTAATPAEGGEDEPEAADATAGADATEGDDESVSSTGAERAGPAASSEESDQPVAVAEGEAEEAATEEAARGASSEESDQPVAVAEGEAEEAATEEAARGASSEESDEPVAVAEGEAEEAATEDAAPGVETDAVLEGPGEEETDPAGGRECSSSESLAESEPEKD
jgi:predicted RNA-binding protein with RPS1 domain